jgi:hypothetical protein
MRLKTKKFQVDQWPTRIQGWTKIRQDFDGCTILGGSTRKRGPGACGKKTVTGAFDLPAV